MDKKEQVFEQRVTRQRSTIYSVCYLFADTKLEADDLFQETLLRLWNGIGSFQHQCSERTWVYRVALNTCISCDRKSKRRPSLQPLEMDVDLFAETAEAPYARQIHERIGCLDLLDRALVLLWLEDLSYDEIGNIVGISPKNVSVRLVRIREKLKNMNH